MNCKFYKVEDAQGGYCRAGAGNAPGKEARNTMVLHDHVCAQWDDCGQNYYIRLGWLKALQAKKATEIGR